MRRVSYIVMVVNRVGEKIFFYSRAGYPSALADIFLLDASVYKKKDCRNY